MEREKIKLEVIGLSYNQVRDGAYVLMLGQVGGPYRIPIVIGASEAQSIAVVLEQVTTPRPLTHDLFSSMGHAMGITLHEIYIYNFEDGIFFSSMTFENLEGDVVEIDSRTSDAIAIALRLNAPIYITPNVLAMTGFIFEQEHSDENILTGKNGEGIKVEIEWLETSTDFDDCLDKDMELDLWELDIPSLNAMMSDAVEKEDYEMANQIKKILEQKKDKDK